jgi:hypothetical protein
MWLVVVRKNPLPHLVEVNYGRGSESESKERNDLQVPLQQLQAFLDCVVDHS